MVYFVGEENFFEEKGRQCRQPRVDLCDIKSFNFTPDLIITLNLFLSPAYI